MIGDILQPTHLLFVLVVALLVLGPKRLPEAGRALGKGIRDFRSAISGEEDRHSELPPDPAPQPAAVVAATPSPPAEYVDHFGAAQPDEFAAPTPPVDHAIQAAVYAATPVEDATDEPANATEQPAESARSAESAHPVG
jgi:sec-independent protein translocase protein TatA